MASRTNYYPAEQQAPALITNFISMAKLLASFTVLLAGSEFIASFLNYISSVNTLAAPASVDHISSFDTTSAAAFLLLGFSLLLRCISRKTSKTQFISDGLLIVVLILAATSIIQFELSRNFNVPIFLKGTIASRLGILFHRQDSPIIDFLFLAVSTAFLFLDTNHRIGKILVQSLLLCVWVLSLIAFIGYVYNALFAVSPSGFPASPFAGAAGFILITMGGLFSRPDKGFLTIISANAAGGVVARRLLPVALVVPPLLCILDYIGFRCGWYNAAFGLAIFTSTNIVVLTTMVWRTADKLNHADQQRLQYEIQRNELHDELLKSNAFRENVFETAIMGVAALDLNGEVMLANRQMHDLFGYDSDELIGKHFLKCIHPEDKGRISALFYQSIHNSTAILKSETQILRRDGTRSVVAFGWSPLIERGRTVGLVTTAEDIMDRKRLESQLLESQKLESIGRLAGGVAHDFNNLLTAIFGYLALAEPMVDSNSALHSYISSTREVAGRAAGLTNQLLAFARRQVIMPKIVDPNDLIYSIESIMKRLISANIELRFVPQQRISYVKVDPNQFEQILINLVVNARDAMPDGGKLTIETDTIICDEEYSYQHEKVKPGEYVMIAVSDTGVGIEEDVKLHIFEPFFTTKAQGQGTGLGLATVYGIVKQSGGNIWIYSEPGKGTTFKIYLPISKEYPELIIPSLPTPGNLDGTETLLLVEDEDEVRQLATGILRARGYTVLAAPDGIGALQLSDTYPGEISILVTDVMLPNMSGAELAIKLQALRPSLRVLFSSGYTENSIVHHCELDSGIAFLPKPFTPIALVQKVHEVLHETAGAA